MQYNQEIVEKMLADSRYVGAVSEKMVKVWKTRETIPNQYFNPKFVEMMKKGDAEKANQVHDPYFNEKFILKTELNVDEKKVQDRLIQIISSEKINASEICKQIGISKTVFFDSFRQEEGKQVDMRSEHLLALKKNLAELKIKVSKVITPLNEKNGRFTEKDVKLIDGLFTDKRLHILPLIKGNDLFRSRIYIRQARKSTMYERDEIQHYINCLALFLVECSI